MGTGSGELKCESLREEKILLRGLSLGGSTLECWCLDVRYATGLDVRSATGLDGLWEAENTACCVILLRLERVMGMGHLVGEMTAQNQPLGY